MEDQKNAILQALKDAGKPLRPGDVAEATGLEKDLVSKLMKSLKNDGLVHSPVRCFWAASE